MSARFDRDRAGHAVSAHGHGTAIAGRGAIAAHGRIRGVAPEAGILSARAFDAADAGPQGSTLSVLKGINMGCRAHARIINA